MSEQRTAHSNARPCGIAAISWSPAPGINAMVTGRAGGCSQGVYADDAGWGGLNLGTNCGDALASVRNNRMKLRDLLPAEPVWLQQVHGVNVYRAAGAVPQSPPIADAAVTNEPDQVLAVLSADCLPVLVADRRARAVAAIHAGWRGLAGGVVEAAFSHLREWGVDPTDVAVLLGPAIGPLAYEVGEDVRDAFCIADPDAVAGFRRADAQGKWMADLYELARIRLRRLGVTEIAGGEACTFSDAARFYSYRRDGVTGRIASLIWIAGAA